ncbi:exported hypothetical protein [Verrucomicrobia bacterium]|nr:exported hypothetical protein [Verrucomicrobiota bacterium]
MALGKRIKTNIFSPLFGLASRANGPQSQPEQGGASGTTPAWSRATTQTPRRPLAFSLGAVPARLIRAQAGGLGVTIGCHEHGGIARFKARDIRES